MEALRRADQFHKTAVGYAVFGLVELGLAYGFALWAIDAGNVWLYFITVVLFAGSLQDLVKLIGKVISRVKTR